MGETGYIQCDTWRPVEWMKHYRDICIVENNGLVGNQKGAMIL